MAKESMGRYIGKVHTYCDEYDWQILNEHGELIARVVTFKSDAERIQDSLNACISFQSPLEDIPKLVEALKSLVRYEQSLKSAIPCLIDAREALALYREGK